MDFSGVWPILEAMPLQLQFVLIGGSLYLVFKYLEIKYVHPKNSAQKGIEEKVEQLELHITNHLTTATSDLTKAVALMNRSIETRALQITSLTASNLQLAQVVRDMQEQANRVANTGNVILEKIDLVDRSISRLEGALSRQ
jgi:predicted RNA-binding protein with PIN domain